MIEDGKPSTETDGGEGQETGGRDGAVAATVAQTPRPLAATTGAGQDTPPTREDSRGSKLLAAPQLPLRLGVSDCLTIYACDGGGDSARTYSSKYAGAASAAKDVTDVTTSSSQCHHYARRHACVSMHKET
jgi:hypothetical protein